MRAFPHSKAQLEEFLTTTQVTRLALSGNSISRKCHESVMSSVMESGVKR
jgi:Ran GTPase-activating protein (RanGAP) involved in mRNA processing and transport